MPDSEARLPDAADAELPATSGGEASGRGDMPGANRDAAAVEVALRIRLSPAEMQYLNRLAYFQGVSPDVLASEWISRELRWLLSIRRG